MRASAKAGRIGHLEKLALCVSTYAVWRHVRRARRRLADTVERYRWRVRTRPAGSAAANRARLEELMRGHLAEPELPTQPPAPEAEARGEGGREGEAAALPEATAWWHEERERQRAAPFRAGGVTTAALRFEPGQRPSPPRGCYYSWGPETTTSTLPPEEREAIWRLLGKDVRSGALEAVDWSFVDAVCPLHIVRHPVTGKCRLVHDARAINARLVASTLHLPRPAEALLGLGWAAKLDLAQAFRHVAIEEHDQRVMCVVVDGVPLAWRALSFGLCQSPELFAAALEDTLRQVRTTLPPGAAIVVYVDDILVVACDKAVLDAAVARLLEGLRGGGWRVALEKVFPHAMRAVPFLGLIADVERGTLRVSKAKATRLQELCSAALRDRRTTLRDLQRIGGLLAFFTAAAPEAGLCRAGINAATAEAERLPGRTVGVKGRLEQDLVFWQRCASWLPELSAIQPGEEWLTVCTDHAGLPSLAWGGIVWEAGEPPPAVDASIDAARAAVNQAGTAGVQGNVQWLPGIGGGVAVAGPTGVALASESSAALEVHAVRRVLAAYRRRYGPAALRGRRIRWLCDAQVAVGAVGRWRAKAAGLSHQVFELLKELRAWGCSICPEWVAREAGWQPIADALSKLRWARSTAEWSMRAADRARVLQSLGAAAFDPSVDLFATQGNQACPAFVSRWPETGAAWCDAFSRGWSGLRAWAFPPYAVAAAALRHAARARDFEGVFVVPAETAVPAGLRVVCSVDVDRVRLVHADGWRPWSGAPHAMRALRVVAS